MDHTVFKDLEGDERLDDELIDIEAQQQ